LADIIDDTELVNIGIKGFVNFDDYNLDSPDNDLSANGNFASFNESYRSSTSILSKNWGDAFSGDFIHRFKFLVNTPPSVTQGTVIIWAVCAEPATYSYISHGPDCVKWTGDEKKAIMLSYNYNDGESEHRLSLHNYGVNTVEFNNINISSWVYIELKRTAQWVTLTGFYDEFITPAFTGQVQMYSSYNYPYHEIAGRGQRECETGYTNPDAYVSMQIGDLIFL